jgi:hypothetical protein
MLTELRLPYADTSAAALRWSPTRSDKPALETLELTGDGARLELVVLGSSHAATLRTPLFAPLDETVACLQGDAGEPVPPARDLRHGRASYRFSSEVTVHDRASLTDLASGLRRTARERHDRIVGVFPGELDALTVLEGALEPGAARWQTWHLYPNTGEAVRTTTTVTW